MLFPNYTCAMRAASYGRASARYALRTVQQTALCAARPLATAQCKQEIGQNAMRQRRYNATSIVTPITRIITCDYD